MQQKAQFERDFSEREASIIAHEEELATLKEQVSIFPKQLESAVAHAKKETQERIETQYKHQIELASKEQESERKLSSQIIESLQAKIKEQEAFIKQLNNKADNSANQVQEIALKAIEGSSSRSHYYAAQRDETKTQTNNH